MGKTDKFFVLTTLSILIVGIFVFGSASLGILAKNKEIFYSIIANQFLLGLCGGSLVAIALSRIHPRFWKKWALPLFLFSIAVAVLVFVPGIGLEHNGAKRWLNLPGISFQPSELLKFGLILYLSAWLSLSRKTIMGLIILFVLLGATAAIMLKQPDTGTFIVMAIASISVFFVSGASWKKIFAICLIGAIGLSFLVFTRPYLKDRITTFLDPKHDPLNSSYQIQQSLIAIGSGELSGRGLGQSVQKFSYLPEPVGDSIFAVIGEELGFIGGSVIVLLFLLFALRGLKVANSASNPFESYFCVGLVMLIIGQSFLNIASLIGIFPLTGVPLVFISHGGTALFFALAEVGIIASISRYQKDY